MFLGIKTAPQEELGCSSAEMVYGSHLTVPRDFFPSLADTHDDTALCFRHLRDQVRSLIAIPTSYHGTVRSSVPQNQQWAKLFFIRFESMEARVLKVLAHRKSLQRPYEGPFKVIQSCLKTFQVDVGGRS